MHVLITQYRHYRMTSTLTGSTAWRGSSDSPNIRDIRKITVRKQVNNEKHEKANLPTRKQINQQK